MKQVVQNFDSGEIEVIELPSLSTPPGFVKVNNHYSVISSGTEKSTVEVGRSPLWKKAMLRPDLVKKVWENFKREGFWDTFSKVRKRLKEFKPLGYSSAGRIEEVGERVTRLQPGDRVACAGANFACHAEEVLVPESLCAVLPEDTSVEDGAFGTLGAISLQSIRKLDPEPGDRVVVLGLGLIGLLTGKLLQASGCRVIGLDIDEEALEVAESVGFDRVFHSGNESVQKIKNSGTDLSGFDGVILSAATDSSEPVEQAGELCRSQGTVVVLGDVNVDVPRESYYMKEITFRYSRAYGPGSYELWNQERDVHYPEGHVPWTVHRNLRSALELFEEENFQPSKLVTDRFKFDRAREAYTDLVEGEGRFVGLFEYPRETEDSDVVEVHPAGRSESEWKVGMIGAGNYASAYLLPEIDSVPDAKVESITSRQGVKARRLAEEFEINQVVDSAETMLSEDSLDVVFVVTRHNTHAEFVNRALELGKAVFVEKPLCLHEDELSEIRETIQDKQGYLQVGFNRRFSDHFQYIAEKEQPLRGAMLQFQVNAGSLENGHWLLDPEVGGGRLRGEGCHFFNFGAALFGDPKSVTCRGISPFDEAENFSATVRFENENLMTLQYCSEGNTSYPRESYQLFNGGVVYSGEDFERTERISQSKQDTITSDSMGRNNQIQAFFDGLEDGEMSMPWPEIWNSTRLTLKAQQSLETGREIEL